MNDLRKTIPVDARGVLVATPRTAGFAVPPVALSLLLPVGGGSARP